MTIISKRARYAFHGLAYVAAHSEGMPVSFDRILGYLQAYSHSLTLSKSYIAKIFQDVSRAGFTVAVSGPGGGYQLARDPRQIRLIEIIESLDGPLLTSCCLMSVGGCSQQPACGVQRVIREAELGMYRTFERETLASLAGKMEFPEPSVIQAHSGSKPA